MIEMAVVCQESLTPCNKLQWVYLLRGAQVNKHGVIYVAERLAELRKWQLRGLVTLN